MAVAFVRYRQFDAITHQVGRNAALRSARNMTRFTRLDAQRTVPIRTGQLRGSVTSNVSRETTGAEGTVRYRADHAMAVHEGARPHVITPRNPGGVLVFSVGGRRIVTELVNHPGQRSNPWLYRALERQGRLRDYRVRRRPASIL